MEEISVLTLKASIQGLEKIKYAREHRGLAIDNEKWLYEASEVLEPGKDWEARGQFANGVSDPTFKRFYYGTQPILALTFQAFCHVLGLNWEEVVEQVNENPIKSPFNIIRDIETQCYEEIKKPGALIRIKAPEQRGKTWLLEKILDFSRNQGYHTVKLDFRLADSTLR